VTWKNELNTPLLMSTPYVYTPLFEALIHVCD